MLVFSCFCLVVGDMLFGFVRTPRCETDVQDTGSFGGILAMPVSARMIRTGLAGRCCDR